TLPLPVVLELADGARTGPKGMRGYLWDSMIGSRWMFEMTSALSRMKSVRIKDLASRSRIASPTEKSSCETTGWTRRGECTLDHWDVLEGVSGGGQQGEERRVTSGSCGSCRHGSSRTQTLPGPPPRPGTQACTRSGGRCIGARGTSNRAIKWAILCRHSKPGF